jgi:hypothetical protein
MPLLWEGDQQEGLPFDNRATFLRTLRLISPNVSDRQILLLRLRILQSLTKKRLLTYQMANNVLVEAFAQLSTSDSKQDALEALIQKLTPYEWRFVQSLTSTRTFQFDIIGRLPVELVAEVIPYLDTVTPWRLQHVGTSTFRKPSATSMASTSRRLRSQSPHAEGVWVFQRPWYSEHARPSRPVLGLGHRR